MSGDLRGPRGRDGLLTREAWLHQAIEAFRPRFAAAGLPLPAKIHVGVGFGYGAKRESAVVLGQCWARRASADGVNHIFISPQEADPAAMLVTLLHELIHAADDCASGHRGPFAAAAARLGFGPPLTSTPPGPALAADVAALAKSLGPFPHAALNPVPGQAPPPAPPDGGAPPAGPPVHSGPGKQGTRLIKVTAAGCCGYTARTTAKWLETGEPRCPHGTPMTRAS
jgi:hypothetical protein